MDERQLIKCLEPLICDLERTEAAVAKAASAEQLDALKKELQDTAAAVAGIAEQIAAQAAERESAKAEAAEMLKRAQDAQTEAASSALRQATLIEAAAIVAADRIRAYCAKQLKMESDND